MKRSDEDLIAKAAMTILTLPGVQAAVKAVMHNGALAVAGVIAPYLATAGALIGGPVGAGIAALVALNVGKYIIANWDDLT
jgi:hypothetical protein